MEDTEWRGEDDKNESQGPKYEAEDKYIGKQFHLYDSRRYSIILYGQRRQWQNMCQQKNLGCLYTLLTLRGDAGVCIKMSSIVKWKVFITGKKITTNCGVWKP